MPAKNLHRVDGDGTYYHVYNKGIESRIIFADEADYQVFLAYLEEYLSTPKSHENTKQEFTVNGRVYRGVPHQPKNYFKKVELIAYSLKPDHFHLLLHQITQKSLQAFIRSLCTRYSMYFNKKYNHTGSLFDGPYKSVIINDETSLLLLTRYLHKDGGYSTYPEYSGVKLTPWVRTKVVLSIKNKQSFSTNSKGNYKDFVEKYEPNQKEKGLLEEIAIENVDKHLERRDLAGISSKPSHRIPEFLAASAVFVLLLGLGIRNINISSSAASSTLGTKTFSASPTPTLSPKPKIVLTVRYTEGPVNIREKPTVQSKKNGAAKDGDKFEFVSENSGWYQVKLPDGQNGFISSKYIETGGTSN